jgi:hypothetical protein
MKPSTEAAVRDHRNAVRDRSESLSAFNRIAVRNRRNPQAIERLDNEGGVSSQASKQKEVDKVRMHRRSISANRDEQEDRLPDFGLGMNAGQQQHRDKNECSRC